MTVKKYETIIATKIVAQYNKRKSETVSVKAETIDKNYNNPHNLEDFETLNAAAHNLESANLVSLSYTNKYNEDIKKISATHEAVVELAKMNGLVLADNVYTETMGVLAKYEDSPHEAIRNFVASQLKAVSELRSVKYVNFNTGDTGQLANVLLACTKAAEQTEDIMERVFSTRVFNDSKTFESIEIPVMNILLGDYENIRDALAVCHIFKNPISTQIKGCGTIRFKNGDKITLDDYTTPIQLTESFVGSIESILAPAVMSIENLTTFNTYAPNKELVIYLEGFASQSNVRFLSRISHDVPIYHFGDIDAKGFEILHDLQKRLRRPVHSYMMDVETIQKYSDRGKQITDFNKTRLAQMIKSNAYTEEENTVFNYLLDKGITIEQEVIESEVNVNENY